MEPEQLQTSEKPAESKPDVKEDMLQFAKGVEKAQEQEDEDPKPDPKSVDEDPDKDPEDGEEDSKEEKDPEDKDDDKKRPNRYQKQKAKIEALEILHKKATADTNEAVKIANVYRNRLKEVLAKYEQDAKAWREGKGPSDVEQENWSLKARQREAEYQSQIDKQNNEASMKQEILQQKQIMVTEFQSEALGYSKSLGFVGDDSKAFARKVLLHYATEQKLGNNVTMKEVAQELAQLSKTRIAGNKIQEQHDVNRNAPTTLRPGGNRVPSYDIKGQDDEASKKTMAAYLASLRGKK